MLEAKTQAEIAAMVRSGFYNRERLIKIFTEEIYAPDELNLNDVAVSIDTNFAEYEKEKREYPTTTDCDRLDTAFARMNERGVIAVQNAGYTQSDGYEDVGAVYSEHPDKERILGYCFYHGQDLERAINGGSLYFAFGPVDPAEEQTIGVEVGTIIRKELERAGLAVDWDGTFENRLSISKLNWQKH